MGKDSKYRENPERAVFVTGEINEGMVHRLTPLITKLRLTSDQPITVYIDSRGGSVRSALHLQNLLRSPSQDRETHWIITVATTQAKSAAAILLASGDYSIAYPNAEIMHHGSRLPDESEITTEKASDLVDLLSSVNEEGALDLADLMFPRLVLLHIFNRNRYADISTKIPKAQTGAQRLAEIMRESIRPDNIGLIETALSQMSELDILFAHVSSQITIVEGDPLGKVELALLRSILDFEEKRNDLNKWGLSTGGLEQIRRDFLLLNKFFAQYYRSIARKVDGWGHFFLTDDQRKEFEAIIDTDAKRQCLAKHATPMVEKLWTLTVILAQALHKQDCHLTPIETYWLGLVDEVVGSDLPCKRIAIEANS